MNCYEELNILIIENEKDKFQLKVDNQSILRVY
jgi:hypothetical protein